MKVKNINGTSGNTCNCGSWLKHWKEYSGSSLPTYCVEQTCTNPPEVGAHVQKDGSTDRNWYIIPLCKAHNAKTNQSLTIVSVTFVSANVANTCG